MIVFVTGATGALGQPTVAALLAAGHTVRALVRSGKSAEQLRAAGAEPVEGNLYKPETWTAALTGAGAILHLATKVPPPRKARRKLAWGQNDRLRTEGTKLLAVAALGAGVERLIYPSVTMVYADGGSEKLAAGAEGTREQPTWILASTMTAEQEVARFTERGGTGVVLRLGNLYGRTATRPGHRDRAARGVRVLRPARGVPGAGLGRRRRERPGRGAGRTGRGLRRRGRRADDPGRAGRDPRLHRRALGPGAAALVQPRHAARGRGPHAAQPARQQRGLRRRDRLAPHDAQRARGVRRAGRH